MPINISACKEQKEEMLFSVEAIFLIVQEDDYVKFSFVW